MARTSMIAVEGCENTGTAEALPPAARASSLRSSSGAAFCFRSKGERGMGCRGSGVRYRDSRPSIVLPKSPDHDFASHSTIDDGRFYLSVRGMALSCGLLAPREFPSSSTAATHELANDTSREGEWLIPDLFHRMSLEQRCQQFHEAAMGVGKSKGPVKEVTTMRKFLHKNQDQRFTDKGVSRLFDSIQLYIHKEGLDSEYKEGLLEDSLKMPFTVFSTKQKKSMLKWLETLRGGGAPTISAGDSSLGSDQSQMLSVIDILDGKLSLMDDETGDTYEDIPLPPGELGAKIQNDFDNTDSVVSVEAQIENDVVTSVIDIQQ